MQRHHYVPQFYLNHWRVPEKDKFWLYCHSEKGEVLSGLRSARSVCYQRGLYSSVPDMLYGHNEVSNEIETKYLSPLDSESSNIHRKILSQGVNSLSQEERIVWALFINSLLCRSPDFIERENIYARKFVDEAIYEIRDKLSDIEGKKYPWNTLNLSATASNTVLKKLEEKIGQKDIIESFINMLWTTVTQPTGNDHFLTGDSPVVINAGNSNSPTYCLSFAVSPNTLFIMHEDNESFDEEFIKTIAAFHSILVAKQTRKYLISSRELEDNGHVKYKRVLYEIFANRS